MMLPWGSSPAASRIRSWLRDYDRIQSAAVLLLYIQIGCAMIGSLGAVFNGVLLIDLVVALFALVAIESNSQSLGRTYAVLLLLALMLDVAWFVLFSRTIWNIHPDEEFGSLSVFSLRLALSMEIIGFSVRVLSSFLWIQMYRLGASTVDSTFHRAAEYNARSSLLSPSMNEVSTENLASDDILGGSIYDPAYFSSLFEDARDIKGVQEGDAQIHLDNNALMFDPPQLRSCISRSFQVIEVDNASARPLNH